MTIIATDTHAKYYPPRRNLVHRGELARDRQRMPQWQQVNADHYANVSVQLRYGRDFHETVSTRTIAKRDVIRHEQVVDAVIDDGLHQSLLFLEFCGP